MQERPHPTTLDSTLSAGTKHWNTKPLAYYPIAVVLATRSTFIKLVHSCFPGLPTKIYKIMGPLAPSWYSFENRFPTVYYIPPSTLKMAFAKRKRKVCNCWATANQGGPNANLNGKHTTYIRLCCASFSVRIRSIYFSKGITRAIYMWQCELRAFKEWLVPLTHVPHIHVYFLSAVSGILNCNMISRLVYRMAKKWSKEL